MRSISTSINSKGDRTRMYIAIYQGPLIFSLFQGGRKLDTAHRPVVMGSIEAESIINAWHQYRVQLLAELKISADDCLAMMKDSILVGANTKYFKYEEEA